MRAYLQLCTLMAIIPVALAASIAGHRETVSEAAHNARDLIKHRSDGLGTFATVFPQGYGDELDGLPIAGMEYIAPAPHGDLYILAMPISKQIRNALQSPTHNATVAIKDEAAERSHGPYGATNRNRLTLFGHLETIQDEEGKKAAARAFGKTHKDAKAYFPGNGPHFAFWTVFKVEKAYWVGGFGDTHYIGWIPIDMYRDAEKQDTLSSDSPLLYQGWF